MTTNIGTADINELKQELKVLKTDIRADQNLTEGLREIVIELKDKVLNISSSSQGMIPMRSNASCYPKCSRVSRDYEFS